MRIKGTVRVGCRTKELVKRLRPGEIALVSHRDMDELAARSLAECRVQAVLNTDLFASGRFPNSGPGLLLDKGVVMVEDLGQQVMEKVKEGELVEVIDGQVVKDGEVVARGRVVTPQVLHGIMEMACQREGEEIESFLRNTLEHARREKELLLGTLEFPPLGVEFRGRHALIVVRGQGYREDLEAIKAYIREVRPVLVGVDGGADALLEFGYRPDVIVGDMDSISDKALRCGAELVVHAYLDGRAPGLCRLKGLGLKAHEVPAPGTSEDLAMLLAYHQGAELLVAVGSHSNFVDFLEKGRPGMASTLLVRMKVGRKLVDARGVSKLYRYPFKYHYVLELLLAALIPVLVVTLVAPATPYLLYFRLLAMKVRLVMGW